MSTIALSHDIEGVLGEFWEFLEPHYQSSIVVLCRRGIVVTVIIVVVAVSHTCMMSDMEVSMRQLGHTQQVILSR